jgi:hypothetical protein
MKIRLTRDSRITHKAGEIVEVSPAEGVFLVSVQSAVEIRAEEEKTAKAVKQTAKRSAEK